MPDFKKQIQRQNQQKPKKTENSGEKDAQEALGVQIEDVVGEQYLMIDCEKIEDNPFQPRKKYNEKKLQELSDSIKEEDLLQPIVIVPIPDKPGYFYVAYGHRRLRATRMGGFLKIKAIVRHLDMRQLKLVALIENIQRVDLTILEEANTYLELQEDGYTDGDIAKAASKTRPYINKMLRVPKLPKEIIDVLNSDENVLSKSVLFELVPLDEDALKKVWDQLKKEHLTIKQLRTFIQEVGCSTSNTPKKTEHKKDEKAGCSTSNTPFKVIKYNPTARKHDISFTAKELRERGWEVIAELEILIKQLHEEATSGNSKG